MNKPEIARQVYSKIFLEMKTNLQKEEKLDMDKTLDGLESVIDTFVKEMEEKGYAELESLNLLHGIISYQLADVENHIKQCLERMGVKINDTI